MEWIETVLLAVQMVHLLCLWARLDRVLAEVRATGRALEALQAPEPEGEAEDGAMCAAMLEGFDSLMGYSEQTARGVRE